VASTVPNNEATQFKSGEKQVEIARRGGIASGKAKREKATFKNAIKWLVESDIKITNGNIYEAFKDSGIDISKLNTTQLATIGLWYGAVRGNSNNFKTLMEGNEEINPQQETKEPIINIQVKDNSNLADKFWEEEK
jgi:hypothetical protein